MSLSEHKTPAIIETEILMQRLVHKGSFLLLEGSDDSKFWNLYVVKDKCEKVICGGKTKKKKGALRCKKTRLTHPTFA